MSIKPHGGNLVNRVVTDDAARAIDSEAATYPIIAMCQQDYRSVCGRTRLAGETVRPTPFILSTPEFTRPRSADILIN